MLSYFYGIASLIAILGTACWGGACWLRIENELSRIGIIGRVGSRRIHNVIINELKRSGMVALIDFWLTIEYLMKANNPSHIFGSALLNKNLVKMVEIPMIVILTAICVLVFVVGYSNYMRLEEKMHAHHQR